MIRQVILKKHVLPRLVAAKQPGLWLHFVEAAVTFERELAPLRGITMARHPAEDAPELWRRGSCIALVCSVQASTTSPSYYASGGIPSCHKCRIIVCEARQ